MSFRWPVFTRAGAFGKNLSAMDRICLGFIIFPWSRSTYVSIYYVVRSVNYKLKIAHAIWTTRSILLAITMEPVRSPMMGYWACQLRHPLGIFLHHVCSSVWAQPESYWLSPSKGGLTRPFFWLSHLQRLTEWETRREPQPDCAHEFRDGGKMQIFPLAVFASHLIVILDHRKVENVLLMG